MTQEGVSAETFSGCPFGVRRRVCEVVRPNHFLAGLPQGVGVPSPGGWRPFCNPDDAEASLIALCVSLAHLLFMHVR